jgi:hypothetical protein
MKTMNLLCLLLLVLTGTLTGARGAIDISTEDYRTDINPALLYHQAILAVTEPLSDADRAYLASRKGREQKLPERFGKIVSSSDMQFLLLRHAVRAKVPCEWGLDLSFGPNLHLAHLARLKAISRTAQLRVAWALQQGRQDDACEDLVATFVMGRNAASDGLLISSFVQFAIEATLYETVAEHFGEFSPEIGKRLVDGFEAAPPRRTVAACMPSEKALGEWLHRKIRELQKAYPHDDAKVMAEFRDAGVAAIMDFMGDKDGWPRILAASGGTSQGVIQLLQEAGTFFPRLAGIMALPPSEYEVQAKQLGAEILKSPNPFIQIYKLILGWQNWQFRQAEFKTQARLAMVRAAMEFKLHGESGFKTVTDPFGGGPLSFQRFVFKGVDRGFELRSVYAGSDAPYVMIFVEKKGPAFQVTGPEVGKAVSP